MIKVRPSTIIVLAILGLGMAACSYNMSKLEGTPWIWSSEWDDNSTVRLAPDVTESRTEIAPATLDKIETVVTPPKRKKSKKRPTKKRKRRR